MTGTVIGTFNHQLLARPVRLPAEALSGHVLVLGKTQRGKSALLATLMQAIAEDEQHALVLFDPHGDLAASLRGLIPRHRIPDVVNLDLSDLSHPLALNLLAPTADRSLDKLISDFVDVGKHLWADNWGPRMEDVLRFSLKMLVLANRSGTIPLTILDANRLLTDRFFRRWVMDRVTDAAVKRYWEFEYERLSDSFRNEIIKPVLTKLNRLGDADATRLLFGQVVSTLNLEQILDQHGILIVNAAKGLVGADVSALVSSLLLSHLKTTIAERQAKRPSERQRVTIVVDELQTLVSTTYEGILSEIAKYGVNLILATQTLDLLDTFDPALRPIVISNVSTLFCFETSADDAQYLVGELDEVVTVRDLTNLPRYTCYCKTFKGTQRLPVFSLTTLPPHLGDQSVAEQIITRSRQVHGRPRALVEKELAAREQQIDEAIKPPVQEPVPPTTQRAAEHSLKRPKPSRAKRPSAGQP